MFTTKKILLIKDLMKYLQNLQKKIVPNENLVHLTNKSILDTFKKIKKDKSPFSNKKITLSVYKEFLKKIKYDIFL